MESVKLGELDLLDGDLGTSAVPDVYGLEDKEKGFRVLLNEVWASAGCGDMAEALQNKACRCRRQEAHERQRCNTRS